MKGRPWFFPLLFLFAFILFSGEAADAAALPKGKTIAVLVRGTPSHGAAVRSILTRALLEGGYRAVDEQQLERIRRSKAAALALEGDVDAILQLGKSFGFSVLLSGTVTVPKAVKNEFGLFTATAALSITACSAADGRQILAVTESAKEIGYTPEEAAQKAAETAGRSAAEAVLGKRSQGQQEIPAARFTVIVSPIRSFAEAHGIVESCRNAGALSASLVKFSAGKAEVDAEFAGSAGQFSAALLRMRTDFSEDSAEGNVIRLGKQ